MGFRVKSRVEAKKEVLEFLKAKNKEFTPKEIAKALLGSEPEKYDIERVRGLAFELAREGKVKKRLYLHGVVLSCH